MRKAVKRIMALAIAVLMIAAFLPAMQTEVYAATAKKPAKVTGVTVKVADDNQVPITWKKAKNAKKYNVSVKDGVTGLTAVKSVSKTTMKFKGGNAVKYTVKVQGVNGKTKGAYSASASATTNDFQAAVQAQLAEAIAAKEKAEKELADLRAAVAVTDAWREVPAIDENSDAADIAAAQAVIAAYDELTDDQKALIPESITESITAAKAVIGGMEEAAAKIEAVRQAIREGEAGSSVTIDEEAFLIVSKENGKAELILKNGIEGVPFDTNGGYDWSTSSLRTYLNSPEGWLSGMPTVSVLAETAEYSYSIGEYDMNEDDFIYQAKTSTDRVYIPAFDGQNYKTALPSEVEAQLKDSCAFWTSCGCHLAFYDEGEYIEQQLAYSIGEALNLEEDTSATTTTYDGGASWVPIKVNPMFTVSLD